MPTFVTAFTSLISELQTGFARKLPASAWLPLAVAGIALLSIYTYVNDGSQLEQLWSTAGILERTLIAALGLVGSYVLAYIAWQLQPLVESLFQNSLPLVRSLYLRLHADEWDRRHVSALFWQSLYWDLDDEQTAIKRLLDGEAPPSHPTVWQTNREIGPFQTIQASDVKRSRVPKNEAPAEGSIERFAGNETYMSRRPIGAKATLTADDVARIPDASWLTGMHLVSINAVASDLPSHLDAGAVVSLVDVKSGSRPLVPGGALVVDVQPRMQVAEPVFRGQLVHIVVAIPPDREQRVLTTQAAGQLRLVQRLSPPRTPLWNDGIPRTRRWMPALADGAAYAAGDVLDLTGVPSAPGGTIARSIFAEAIDDGFVLAVPVANADSLTGIAPGTLGVNRSMVSVPYLLFTIDDWTVLNLTGELPGISGEVRSGIFRTTDGASHPDIVIDARELRDRYSTHEIPAAVPIKREWLGPSSEEKDSIAIIDIPGDGSSDDAGAFAHLFKPDQNGQTGDIAFNCRVLRGRTCVVPSTFSSSKASVERIPVSRIPETWTDPRNASLLSVSPGEIPPNDGLTVVYRRLESGVRSLATAVMYAPWRALVALPVPVSQEHDYGGKVLVLIRDPERTFVCDSILRPSMTLSEYLDQLSSISPYRGEVTEDDTASAIASRLQRAQIARKLLTISNETPYQDTARAILRQYNRDFPEMQKQCLTYVDRSRTAFRLPYPRERSAVRPTAIGNILQSVESYGYNTYGLDTPLVLPRITAVVDKEDALKPLDDAREHFRLVQWSCLAALVIGVVGSIIAAYGHERGLMFGLWLAMLVIAPPLLYRAMVSAALAYAEQLRMVLDRYRGHVLGALGITPQQDKDGKTQVRDEKQTWEKLGQWWEYSDQDFKDGYVLDRGSPAEATTKP